MLTCLHTAALLTGSRAAADIVYSSKRLFVCLDMTSLEAINRGGSMVNSPHTFAIELGRASANDLYYQS